MGAETEIAWTDHTFNPWWGCQRVSPGCENCYAEAWDRRWGGKHWGPGDRRFFGDAHWHEPVKWNRDAEKAGRRARVFCASMADVFEDRRDLDEQRERLFELIERTPHLDWQLLTKRPENMIPLTRKWWPERWPANVWAGTTVEDQIRADARIPALLRVPAEVRFLSCEPLLERVDLRLVRFGPAPGGRGELEYHRPIHWVIPGGESGPGARPCEAPWIRDLIAQCRAVNAAVFVKQLGAWADLEDAKGADPSEWPEDLRVREFPAEPARSDSGWPRKAV